MLKNYLPVLIFVLAYAFADIFVATAALMITVTLQVGLYLLFKKPIGMELKVTFWAGLVLGSLTLILRDPLFVQWKTTIVNWVMACVLVGTHFFGKSYGTEVVFKKLLLNVAEKIEEKSQENEEDTADTPIQNEGLDEHSDEEELAAQKPYWRTLNLIWIASFTIAGALNLIVAYNFSMDFWVSYKVAGGMVLSMTTVIISMVYLYKKGLLDQMLEMDEEHTVAGQNPE